MTTKTTNTTKTKQSAKSRCGVVAALWIPLLTGVLASGCQSVPPVDPPPTVEQVNPPTGPLAGGTTVRITGRNLQEGSTVTFGDVPAPEVVFLTTRRLSATLPPHAAGRVDVTVITPDNRSASLPAGFAYVAPAFTDVTSAAGVVFAHRRSEDLMPFGGGVALADFDGDGLLDLYVTNSVGANALYRNSGELRFVDVAARAVQDAASKSNGACAADYDNDGDTDLYVANYGPSRLFRNGGDATFEDVTAAAGFTEPTGRLRTMGCAWGDYDADGFLDLIFVRHLDDSDPGVFAWGQRDLSEFADPLALFRNRGDGTFAEVTTLLGDPAPARSIVRGAGFQPAFVDYDNDGDLDIYVVNDFGEEITPNVLWRNDGPAATGGSWVFTDVSASSGTDVAMNGMGLALGDYDLDGFTDFYITNIDNSVLLRNNGDGTFSERTHAAGVGRGRIGTPEGNSVGWGTAFFDYDNDGDQDLYLVAGYLDTDPDTNPVQQPNALFRNDGDGTFTDLPLWASGTNDTGFGRGAAFGDLNGDGCLDLYVVNIGEFWGPPGFAKLFLNNCTYGNNWLVVRTVGTHSNRDGIGATITIAAAGSTQRRTVTGGSSHMSQNMLAAHFGLGDAERVDTLTVRWPSGRSQTLTMLAANQVLVVTEPDR